MGDATENLAVDNHRVDHRAAVVADDEIEDADVTGFNIDLDLGHRGATGIGHGIHHDGFGCLHARGYTAGQGVSRRARDRLCHIRQTDFHVRHTLHADDAAGLEF